MLPPVQDPHLASLWTNSELLQPCNEVFLLFDSSDCLPACLSSLYFLYHTTKLVQQETLWLQTDFSARGVRRTAAHNRFTSQLSWFVTEDDRFLPQQIFFCPWIKSGQPFLLQWYFDRPKNYYRLFLSPLPALLSTTAVQGSTYWRPVDLNIDTRYHT